MIEAATPARRIAAPRPPEPAPPFRFPVVASLAPLLVAVLLWVVTASPFALLFAVLGPVTAIASFVDSRLGARRTGRRERARFEAELRTAGEAIEAAHAVERSALAEVSPSAGDIVGRAGADPYRWKAVPGEPLLVSAGTGRARSALVVDGAAVSEGLRELRERAERLTGAPVAIDARLGIGVCGPPVLAAAAARALLVQLAWALSPAAHWCATAEPWTTALPHRRGRALRAGFLAEFGVTGQEAALASVAVAPTEAELPGECRVVIRVGPRSAAIVQHPDRERRVPLRVGALSEESAMAWAVRAGEDAARDGLVAAESRLPAVVPLAPLLRNGSTDPTGLACEFAVATTGAVTVDLARHGPHAVVGGTTGSGKSELLVSWVLAMAAAAPPERVTFLLVDFKGGSAFAPLAGLPHTVGIVTDLGEVAAARALASLRAELRFRERALADAGAKDIGQFEGLPRLVIVVDEFAAMLTDHPDLHALFADIAARGRSLGVHLVLCTQRPAGVVRDAVLANADLRISLRVNNRADSSAVVGTDAAADLPAQARGSGILAHPDSPPSRVQFAIAGSADVERIASRWAGSPPPRRPWREPLPRSIGPADLGTAPEGVPFGLVDLPHEQRRDTAVWRPGDDGHVLVLGAPRSGKTTALAAFGATVTVPREVAPAWDAIAGLDGARDVTVAIDDLDSLLSRFPQEYRDAAVERLGRVLRDGPGRGIHVVAAAQRLTADVQQLAALMPARLWLRHASRQDLLLAGGETADWAQGLPAGGGHWQGNRVQVVVTAPAASTPVVAHVGEAPAGPLALVTSRPVALTARARAAGREVGVPGAEGADVVIGDVEQWQSQWGALAALRSRATVLFDGCTTADYRALTRSRELPPPLAGLAEAAWRLDDDGGAGRARLPF